MGCIGVIEEIEKQLDTIQVNSTNRISPGGILSALDGLPVSSIRVMFFITANTLNMDNNFLTPLCRQGRIDVQFEITR